LDFPIPIIILNWNGLEDTLECMQSVLKQSFRDLQVYLVDNGSSGEDFFILQKKFDADARVHLIQNRENLGFTRGNNRILEQILSRTSPPPYIALLNNDTQVEPNWLENLLRCAQEAKSGYSHQQNDPVLSTRLHGQCRSFHAEHSRDHSSGPWRACRKI
jgi:GT2 family glycosyltransferase